MPSRSPGPVWSHVVRRIARDGFMLIRSLGIGAHYYRLFSADSP